MKAQNLTISVPYNGCDKNCPYCVSRMTGRIKTNQKLMNRNMEKVLTLAKEAQVSSVLLTGKGEPFLNIKDVLKITKKFKEFPVEIQSNGIWLNKNKKFLKKLYKAGMNVIAFSIDNLKQLEIYSNLFKEVEKNNMIVRIALNLTKMIPNNLSFQNLFDKLIHSSAIKQILIRNITCPTEVTSGPEYEWIKKNADPQRYKKLYEEFKQIITDRKPLRVLLFGMEIYSYQGISISFSDYCIQDEHKRDDLRSLIFQEDGHVYTSWGDKASILF